MSKYCCDMFEYKATNYDGRPESLYPRPRPKGQFEKDSDGDWCINGCCGGGCFVVSAMKYCPFCGKKL